MKELKRELSENEYTYEQLSMMMKSMVSDSRESEELIEGYNEHIAIIELQMISSRRRMIKKRQEKRSLKRRE
jgi:hypothetical protein